MQRRFVGVILALLVALSPLSGSGEPAPARPVGSTLDTGNPLATNLAGLFVMNEGAGTTDQNLVDSQVANFSGSSTPSWNTSDPSIVFNGGNSLSSYSGRGVRSDV